MNPEVPFLLGPQAEIPPPWLEAHASVLLASLTLALGVSWLAWRWLGRRKQPEDPGVTCQRALARARQSPDALTRVTAATAALRAYLAAVCAEAPAGLSTEQLTSRVGTSPLLATAADPIIRALRTADRAKFAGATVEDQRLLEQAEDALARVELARRALWKEALR